jgi:hypothetical protein
MTIDTATGTGMNRLDFEFNTTAPPAKGGSATPTFEAPRIQL